MARRVHDDEEGRLAALRRCGLVAGERHETLLEQILAIAKAATGASAVAISIVTRSEVECLAAKGVAPYVLARQNALASEVVETRQVVILENGAANAPIGDAGAYLGVPILSSEGYGLGAIEIIDGEPRRFSAREIAAVTALGPLVADIFAGGEAARNDALTGALTRRRFQDEVEREFSRTQRYGRPAALIFFDVDGFKDINDVLGLETADEILRTIANRCAEKLRSTDSFGRIGGQAFGILVPETLAYEAGQCAERLRGEVSRLRFRNDKGIFSVTASFGVAPLTAAIKSAVHWFARADIALYEAKAAGRDQVAMAQDTAGKAPSRAEDTIAKAAARLH